MAETTPRTPRKATKKTASTRKRPPDQRSDGTTSGNDSGTSSSSSNGRRTGLTGARVALLAAQQLAELTGRELEGIVGISRTDDGWTVQAEVLELRRIPDTTDVLAIYEVSVDEHGELTAYRRTERYARGSAGEGRR